MTEHKRHPRLRTLKAGKIIFNRHFSVVDCTVRNLSATGACLELPSTAGIPERFDLVIGPNDTRACCVAWKEETRLGVSFSLRMIPKPAPRLIDVGTGPVPVRSR